MDIILTCKIAQQYFTKDHGAVSRKLETQHTNDLYSIVVCIRTA